jgi:Zn-dependent protease
MDMNDLIDGLMSYISLVILLTFHEWGHAWMASKCGDDTARGMGRCSLNPLVHIDPIGTFLIPLVQIFFPAFGGILIGWAKPVPVNPNNLRNPKLDDILISMAGPWMNLFLAVVLFGLAKVGLLAGALPFAKFCNMSAILSLALCFFNLIPIPPLDGSRVMRVLIGMSNETFYQFAQYGFIILILVINLTPIPSWVSAVVYGSASIIQSMFGLG